MKNNILLQKIICILYAAQISVLLGTLLFSLVFGLITHRVNIVGVVAGVVSSYFFIAIVALFVVNLVIIVAIPLIIILKPRLSYLHWVVFSAIIGGIVYFLIFNFRFDFLNTSIWRQLSNETIWLPIFIGSIYGGIWGWSYRYLVARRLF